MSPLDVQDTSLERRTTEYLLKTSALVAPLYDLEKAGGLSDGNAQGVAFTTDRIAAGASELRNLIVIAWKISAAGNVGWPALKVEDVLAGKADPYDSLYGKD
jgi:hypothetical protein